jgi:exodeoxyribonuclease-5
MDDLTRQQEEARLLIIDWFNNVKSTGKQLFILGGYAGTGKTFLINRIIDDLNLKPFQVAYGTFTGKAASILIQKGREASTIHRLIYSPVEEEYETKIAGETIKSTRIKFVKKESISNFHLIIIDEVSMVDSEMMKDLMSFGIPILASGDPGQLDPISGDNSYMKNPDYFLTDIVRQAEGDPIIQIASRVRNGENIPYGNYGSVIILDRSSLTIDIQRNLLLKADQVICGTNSTRKYLNNEIRKYKGIDVIANKYPIDGEKIIFNVNNWEIYLDEDRIYNLVNGSLGYAKDVKIHDEIMNIGTLSFNADFLPHEPATENIIFDSGVFINDEYTFDMHQKALILPDNKFRLKRYFHKRDKNESQESFNTRIYNLIRDSKESIGEAQINRVDYGYALTLHKFQGSEADKVVVFDESHIFGESQSKWLYTAITRARKKLVIIR